MADLTPLSDPQLLSHILLGECEALEALYDRYGRACYGLALTIAGDSYIAEETVQDVFLKLWIMPSSYAPQRGKFSAWLLTLIRNRSIDRLRHEKHSMLSSAVDFNALDMKASSGLNLADVLADGGNTPYEEVWHRERARVVRNALNLLSPLQREAISLAYLGGLTQREIAQRLGVPLGTIKTRTQRALLHLRKLLSRESLVEDAA